MVSLNRIYKKLLEYYGPQGWWPIVNPETYESQYHLGSPINDLHRFEIAAGAILTQSVAWKNAEKAIGQLKKRELLSPEKVEVIDKDKLAQYIRSTGYYNQKALKLKNFLSWYRDYGYESARLLRKGTNLLREELLAVKGIGPETADSILLYALQKKIFVIDAYTIRIISRIGLISPLEKYHRVQEIFHIGFEGESGDYNEYHALLVAHAKAFCMKTPQCEGCILTGICEKKM